MSARTWAGSMFRYSSDVGCDVVRALTPGGEERGRRRSRAPTAEASPFSYVSANPLAQARRAGPETQAERVVGLLRVPRGEIDDRVAGLYHSAEFARAPRSCSEPADST
jgi:hypothetical protein